MLKLKTRGVAPPKKKAKSLSVESEEFGDEDNASSLLSVNICQKKVNATMLSVVFY